MIASYFIFGIETGAILLFVIMFHEFGHYFAMKKCGYQNVDLAAVPLLGGVTTGIPQSYNQYQQAWVAMWGPLPGIVIATVLLTIGYFLPTTYTTYNLPFEIATFFLLINYLNLLPMLPLDGGHIIMSLIPNRCINIYKAAVITTVILGITVVFVLDLSWFFLLIFTLPLWTITTDIKVHKMIQKIMHSEDYSSLNHESLLMRTIETVKEHFPKDSTKSQLEYTKEIYLKLSETPMNTKQRTTLLCVYLLLFTPLIGAGFYFYSNLTSWQDQIQTSQYEIYEDLKSRELLNTPITHEAVSYTH